eukprot:COSAG01_NODE_2060_length_8520_cov_4.178839_2_plen_241_part_00
MAQQRQHANPMHDEEDQPNLVAAADDGDSFTSSVAATTTESQQADDDAFVDTEAAPSTNGVDASQGSDKILGRFPGEHKQLEGVSESTAMRILLAAQLYCGCSSASNKVSSTFVLAAIVYMLGYQFLVLLHECIIEQPHAQRHPGEPLPAVSWMYPGGKKVTWSVEDMGGIDGWANIQSEDRDTGEPISHGSISIILQAGQLTCVQFPLGGLRSNSTLRNSHLTVEMFGDSRQPHLAAAV